VLPQIVCTRRLKKLAPLREVPRGDLKSVRWQREIALRDSLLKFWKRDVEDVKLNRCTKLASFVPESLTFTPGPKAIVEHDIDSEPEHFLR
jgi:hypothetical protein